MKDFHYYSVGCSLHRTLACVFLCSCLLCSTFSICPSPKSSVSWFLSICFVNLASADKKTHRLSRFLACLSGVCSSRRQPPLLVPPPLVPSTLLLTSSISLLSTLDPSLLLHSLHTHLHSAASLLTSELKTSHDQTIPSLSHAFSLHLSLKRAKLRQPYNYLNHKATP